MDAPNNEAAHHGTHEMRRNLGLVLVVVAALADTPASGMHQASGPAAAWSSRQNRDRRLPAHSRHAHTSAIPVFVALRGGQLGRVPPSAAPERRHLNLQLWEASRLGRPGLLEAVVKQGAEINAAFESKDDARRHAYPLCTCPVFSSRPIPTLARLVISHLTIHPCFGVQDGAALCCAKRPPRRRRRACTAGGRARRS